MANAPLSLYSFFSLFLLPCSRLLIVIDSSYLSNDPPVKEVVSGSRRQEAAAAGNQKGPKKETLASDCTGEMVLLNDNPMKFNQEPVTSQACSYNENGGCMQRKKITVEM